MSHTPGPWSAGKPTEASNFGDWMCRVRAVDGGSLTVAKVSAGNGKNNTPEVAEANANVIAAAPELLAVMEAAVKGLELLPFVTQSAVGIDAMRTAIAKARAK